MDNIKIELTKGLHALIDEEDYVRVNNFSWYAHDSKKGRIYGATRGKKDSEIGLNVFCYLHRFILKVDGNIFVDHINGDTLDNRKQNLRLATPKQNVQNSRKCKNPVSSKYRGVYFFKRDKVWVAQIRGKHIGRFKTEEEAALAYNWWAKMIYKDFANLNIIE